MAGPHQPFGLPDSDLPHQKYMYVCMYTMEIKTSYTVNPITVALKHYLITSTSIQFLTHLQEHTRTLQSFFYCYFFFHRICKPFNISNVLVTPMMKGQAQNVWRGPQTTRQHFCSLFLVEHFFTYRYVTVEPVPKQQLDMPGGHS